MSIWVPICIFCKHFDWDSREHGERDCCKAFPQGIPDAFAKDEGRHLTPYPGDNGIQFEAAEGCEEIGQSLAEEEADAED